jgi:hypothetical protein
MAKTTSKKGNPKPGDMVVLSEIPPGLLNDLPVEDQTAIAEAVGKPILLNEYNENGRAELEFRDRDGIIHFIYVKQDFIARYP